MAKVSFHDTSGRPLRGAVVAITGAPDEMTDLGYVTDDAGAIQFEPPAEGEYLFSLTGPDGGALRARTMLSDGEAEVTATAT
jgi:hypothetical protein